MTQQAKTTLLKDKQGTKLLPITQWGRIIGDIASQTDLQNKLTDLQNKLNAKVSKTGDTMSGALKIQRKSTDTSLIVQYTDLTFDTAPSSTVYPNIEFQDKNGARMGRVEYALYSDGAHQINLIDKKDSTTGSYASISAGFRANGTAFTKAITPSSASDTTDIATTAWVRDRIVKWESGWFSCAKSASVSWNLSSAGMSASNANLIIPEVIGKVITADGNYAVNDIVYGQWSNYVGATGGQCHGYSLCFTGSTLMFSAGNSANWTDTKKGGGQADLLTQNCQYKVILRRFVA